jgi:hypothetical protein
MNPDRDDPLLDACLDEVLGGRRPPDLTARIMQALAQRASANGNVHLAPLPPPIVTAAPPVAPPAVNGSPVVELSPRPLARSRRSPGLEAWLVVAGVLVVGLSIAVVAYVANSPPNVAENAPPNQARPDIAHAHQPGGKTFEQNQLPAIPRDRQPAVVTVPNSAGNKIGAAPDVTPRVARNDTNPPVVAPVAAPPKKYLDPSPDAEIVSFVNAEIARGWTAAGIKPAPQATDAEWCRRLFVRVLGRIPTIAELDQFTADKSPDRRGKLVQRLLSDESYVAEYADHWSVVFSNILIGRTGGEGNSLASREGLQQYLRTALAKNKPYNDVVHELLTATGSSKPGAADHNPAVNFLLDGLDKDATLATSRVSRIFLGHQLQCAQCHQHPSQNWSQEQFWAFNSFFRQMQAQRADGAGQLVNVSFLGQGRGSTEGEVYYETPAGLLKTAFPKFIDGTTIPASGDLAEVNRRGELAKLVVQSDLLPKALVNRVWSHFFGYGFTRPVDDLGPATTPSHPEVLDRLAHEFAARDFDLRSVIRWIALSDSFSRSSKLTDIATKDMPEAGEVALFSRYYSRPMQAEEVYNSLVQAAQIRKTAANESAIEKARVDWLSQFTRNMGTDDAEEELHTGGVRQSLIMMNGDLMKQATTGPQAGLIQSVAASDMKFDKKVEHLFLSALSRPPTRNELTAANTILKNSKNVQQTALEDIWWAILNSNEFILDH